MSCLWDTSVFEREWKIDRGLRNSFEKSSINQVEKHILSVGRYNFGVYWWSHKATNSRGARGRGMVLDKLRRGSVSYLKEHFVVPEPFIYLSGVCKFICCTNVSPSKLGGKAATKEMRGGGVVDKSVALLLRWGDVKRLGAFIAHFAFLAWNYLELSWVVELSAAAYTQRVSFGSCLALQVIIMYSLPHILLFPGS